MPYRDEATSLRARVAQLEDELAWARARVASARRRELELEQGLAAIGRSPGPTRVVEFLAGARSGLTITRHVVGVPSPELFERMVVVLQRGFSTAGETTRNGTALSWRCVSATGNRVITVDVIAEDGKTRIVVAEQISNFMFGALCVVLGVLLGTVPLLILVAIATKSLYLALAFPVAWLLIRWSGVRRGLSEREGRRRIQLVAASQEISAIIELGHSRTESARQVLVPDGSDSAEHGRGDVLEIDDDKDEIVWNCRTM